MRQPLILLVAVLAVCSWALRAEANPTTRYDATTDSCRVLDHGPLEWASRPYGEGGKEFRKVCQGCHYKGNDKGAPFLWTESKSSKAWDRVFAERYPKCAKNGSWDVLDQEQILEVNDYLYRWARGTSDPGNGC